MMSVGGSDIVPAVSAINALEGRELTGREVQIMQRRECANFQFEFKR